MNKKVSVAPRWYGLIPTHNGKPLPKNRWVRAGRVRKWCVRWHAPDGSRPRQTFATKEEAEEFARMKTAEFEADGPQARMRPENITLGAFVDELSELRTGPCGRRLSIGTLREYLCVLGQFSEYIGDDRRMDSIVMGDAARYFACLRTRPSRRGGPLSPASINKHKRNLKSAFNIAIDQLGYLNKNPFQRLKQDKLPRQSIRYVTVDESHAIVRASRSTKNPLWWEAFLNLCYTAGLRTNEATHLTWGDIDFDGLNIHVVAKPELAGIEAWRPKGVESRTVPIPNQTLALLTKLLAVAADGSEFVFLGPARVEWIRQKRKAGTWTEGQDVVNNLDRDFKRIAHRAGVEDVRLHDLRRSAITHWARRLSLDVVQELAGHVSTETTRRYYLKVRPEDMAEARRVAANALAVGPKVDPKWTQTSPKDDRRTLS